MANHAPSALEWLVFNHRTPRIPLRHTQLNQHPARPDDPWSRPRSCIVRHRWKERIIARITLRCILYHGPSPRRYNMISLSLPREGPRRTSSDDDNKFAVANFVESVHKSPRLAHARIVPIR
jgi:hypothetical protein